MGLQTEWVRYGKEKQYSGYWAAPDRDNGQLPAVIVIQEIWGVDEHIQDVTRRFAASGYAAFAPDLYFQNGSSIKGLNADSVKRVRRFMDSLPPGLWRDTEQREQALAGYAEAEREAIRTTLQNMFAPDNHASYIAALMAALAYLREEQPQTKGSRIGTVGFCLGGALAGQIACQDEQLAALVIFYGNAPQKEQLASLRAPVLGIYGDLDKRITDQVPEFQAAMNELGKSFTAHVYDEAPHAFFNDERPSYRAAAARDAFRRTLDFLGDHLQ